MTTLTVAPGNPRDFQEGDLSVLADRLRAEGYDVQIELRESRGHGVTWWEVVHVAADQVIEAMPALVAVIAAWQEERKNRNNKRPQVTIIYGPDGEKLQEVELKPSKDDNEDA